MSKIKVWVFRNEHNDLRYVISAEKPVKSVTYEPKIIKTEDKPAYHGSTSHTIITYQSDKDKQKKFYSLYQDDRDPEYTTTNLSYFNPVPIGVLIPDQIAKEEFVSLKFEDEPISFEI